MDEVVPSITRSQNVRVEGGAQRRLVACQGRRVGRELCPAGAYPQAVGYGVWLSLATPPDWLSPHYGGELPALEMPFIVTGDDVEGDLLLPLLTMPQVPTLLPSCRMLSMTAMGQLLSGATAWCGC